MFDQYFLEFEKILTEVEAGNHGLYKNHDSVFNKWRNIEEQQFLERKLNTIMRGLANNIIENLKNYFPDSNFINDSKNKNSLNIQK